MSILLIKHNRYVKIFIPRMECWFRIGHRLEKVEHVKVTSRILSLMLEIDQTRVHIWVAESEDHVDFCVFLNARLLLLI